MKEPFNLSIEGWVIKEFKKNVERVGLSANACFKHADTVRYNKVIEVHLRNQLDPIIIASFLPTLL